MKSHYKSSAIMLILFALAGLWAYFEWGFSWFGWTMMGLNAIMVFLVIYNWKALSEDLHILGECESPHKCGCFFRTLLLIAAQVLIFIIEIVATIWDLITAG